jgi:hypothetical protein
VQLYVARTFDSISGQGDEAVGAVDARSPMNTNWRARIDRFYSLSSPSRTALKLAATFFGVFVLFLIPAVVCTQLLDMDGHSAAEEPIRAFLYHSIRAPFVVIFGLPLELGGFVGGIVGIIVTLATLPVIPFAFGISATALLEWRRRVSARRIVSAR